ncbi:MAG: leucyl aminopeptidase family protein [Micavibrio aeruginosavorus]|uniref:Leucyl aminopeptidase family protein n=1 Tax=Micavibrio aeruginosavorus TaxID=349221 RepID=A0A7T5R138_9BACT|nr:MAG: leucyl aminopeptidase family protein [Micavibrio aeruginosavorus]
MSTARKPAATRRKTAAPVPRKTARALDLWPDNFTGSAGKQTVTITALKSPAATDWIKKADTATRARATESGFSAKPGQVMAVYDADGTLAHVLVGVNDPVQTFDLAAASDYLARNLSETTLKKTVFTLAGLKGADVTQACIGWGIAGYRFENYKAKKTATLPCLLWPKDADKVSARAHIEAALLVRTLINIPANDLGPDELEQVVRHVAQAEGLSVSVIRDQDLLAKNFPMIYAVGKGSPRRPRLIDLTWGDPKHPAVTLVGKGVCFDTGGLNLKPGAAMYTMKKDMGGGAHALALALLIVRHKLPVRVRVLIPTVENSVSGESFRPSDVINSRKGVTIEVGDTDAEGRLILGDALTYGAEAKPAFMVNFATLTGGVAIGPEVPAMFSNNEKLAFAIKEISERVYDPLWPLPLIQSYRKHIASDIADICSTANVRGGTIHAALFLETFVDPKVDWVHIDLFGWETGGRLGRSKGGTEMGLRALYAYIEERFGSAQKTKAGKSRKTK